MSYDNTQCEIERVMIYLFIVLPIKKDFAGIILVKTSPVKTVAHIKLFREAVSLTIHPVLMLVLLIGNAKRIE